jgi:hypothetical protein
MKENGARRPFEPIARSARTIRATHSGANLVGVGWPGRYRPRVLPRGCVWHNCLTDWNRRALRCDTRSTGVELTVVVAVIVAVAGARFPWRGHAIAGQLTPLAARLPEFIRPNSFACKGANRGRSGGRELHTFDSRRLVRGEQR